MKQWVLILVFATLSCSQARLRQPATIDTNFFFDEIDREKSVVKLFPPENIHGVFQYYFFLQLKNKLGRYTDIEEKDIQLLLEKKENIDFRLERQLRGRYYVKVDTKIAFKQQKLDIIVGGRILKEQFQISMAPVSKKMSKIKFLGKSKNRAKFQLFIADGSGRGIEIPSTPEIVIEPDGAGEIEDLVHIKQGIWEFTMTYPEDNIIMYLSVRAHGVFLEHLYRFQHVEKDRHP